VTNKYFEIGGIVKEQRNWEIGKKCKNYIGNTEEGEGEEVRFGEEEEENW
jgi:hypothetical protein